MRDDEFLALENETERISLEDWSPKLAESSQG